MNAPYASVDPRLGIQRVTQRLYRGYCWHNDTLPAARQLILDKKAEILALVEQRQQARARYVVRFTELLWARAGMAGAPPRWLVDAFGLVESLFAFQALQRDLGRTGEEIVETTTTMMIAALHEAQHAARDA